MLWMLFENRSATLDRHETAHASPRTQPLRIFNLLNGIFIMLPGCSYIKMCLAAKDENGIGMQKASVFN